MRELYYCHFGKTNGMGKALVVVAFVISGCYSPLTHILSIYTFCCKCFSHVL